MLEIRATSVKPSFGWIKISDGERYKYLTVLTCPDIRTVNFDRTLSEKNPSATSDFEELEAGEYAILCLERFSGGIP